MQTASDVSTGRSLRDLPNAAIFVVCAATPVSTKLVSEILPQGVHVRLRVIRYQMCTCALRKNYYSPHGGLHNKSDGNYYTSTRAKFRSRVRLLIEAERVQNLPVSWLTEMSIISKAFSPLSCEGIEPACEDKNQCQIMPATEKNIYVSCGMNAPNRTPRSPVAALLRSKGEAHAWLQTI